MSRLSSLGGFSRYIGGYDSLALSLSGDWRCPWTRIARIAGGAVHAQSWASDRFATSIGCHLTFFFLILGSGYFPVTLGCPTFRRDESLTLRVRRRFPREPSQLDAWIPDACNPVLGYYFQRIDNFDLYQCHREDLVSPPLLGPLERRITSCRPSSCSFLYVHWKLGSAPVCQPHPLFYRLQS